MFSEKVLALAEECEMELAPIFAEIDKTAFLNTEKVMGIFKYSCFCTNHNVSPAK